MSIVSDFFDGVDFKKVETNQPPDLIFLCGGGDSENDNFTASEKYFRPKIHEELENPKRERKVIRAEDVMNWQVSQAFKKDLLDLEKYVAALVSVIPIVCESYGSIAELGAFVSDEIIRKKLYIIIEEKYYVGPDSDSFIRWGPIENYEKNVKRKDPNNKLYCFTKPINENDLKCVCDALCRCEPETSKCNFTNKYFHILLLIDIINILSVASRKEIKRALSYALEKAGQSPLKNYEQIDEMIVVLKALGLIKERIRGEGAQYFIAKQKKFYLDYGKYTKISEVKKQIIQKIYLGKDTFKTAILKEEKSKGDVEWLKKSAPLPLKDAERDSIIRKAPLLYKVYDIPKKSGGTRTIAQPTPKLKQLQGDIVCKLEERLDVHECAKAYKKGINGILENARAHKDNNYFFKYDFKDFFPSIKAADFNIHLERADYSEAERIDLLRAIFRFEKEKNKKKTQTIYSKLNNKAFNQNTNSNLLQLMIEKFKDEFQLSIGAPSSPFVSNTIMFDFDMRMDEWAKANSFVYTRFADDITISCQEKKNIAEITAILKEKLEGLDYPKIQLNDKKQKFLSLKNQVIITGLIITSDHKISLGRKRKKEISAIIHHYKYGKLLQDKVKYLRGWLALAHAVENDFFKTMERKYTPELIGRIIRVKIKKKKQNETRGSAARSAKKHKASKTK